MNIEITREAFQSIVTSEVKAHSTEEHELFRKISYIEKGCYLFMIHNFIGAITQYYIQDINA